MPTALARTSLIRWLSLTVWGLFLGLLLLLSVGGYAAIQLVANRIVPLFMQQVVQYKAQAHEALFIQADESVRRLRLELVDRLSRSSAEVGAQGFERLFSRHADGLWRVRPELVDTERAPTLYLHDGAQGLSASARWRAVASYQLLKEQGPALVPPFFSVYMDFVEDGLMVYARGIDWGANADAQATNTNYPTMLGADPRRNPERKVFWTPVYLDQQAHTWMVSVIAPLDWLGQWAGTLGHDVDIQTLIDSVVATGGGDKLQIVMDGSGNLIAHPQLRERIAAAEGQLQIASLKDPLLDQMQRMVQVAAVDTGTGRTPDGSHWVAWSRIRGPGWYQVDLLPQASVDRMLLLGWLALSAMALLVLVPALWWLRRQVLARMARPLRSLTQAVDTLGQGQVPAPIALGGSNELSRLAGAFDTMVAELVEQRALQTAHAQALQSEVDERRQIMGHWQQERARLLALLGAMDQGILFADNDQQVTYCNATYRSLWGLAPEQALEGQPMQAVLDVTMERARNGAAFVAHWHQAQQAQRVPAAFELALKDGRTLMQNIYPVQGEQGQALGCLWVSEDVTHERQTAAQLVTLAERDALTGLFNRRRFEDELARFFKESARASLQAAVLFFDLDEFKYVNDTFGHRAGDDVLLRVAGEIRALVRGTDVLSRLGGDEFAVLMPHATLHSAQLLAERIVRAVAQTTLHIEGQNLRLTTSLGIAHYPEHASDAQDLVAHADTAMYQAKHLGKNRWSVYRPDRDAAQAMVTRMAWNERIDRALERGLLRLHFQGVYHAHDGSLAHLEALVRMVDEANPEQLIAPGLFIGHAEKSGKILDIDRWVVRQSVRVLAAHPQLPALALNISGRSMDDMDLPEFISAQLLEHGVSPARLLVELTETSAVSDLGDAERFIDTLRRSGCTLCLDDFGTGFASFAYLKHLKVDVLKIDGFFIRNLPQEHDNQVFVRSIIEVARGMGKHTVAEFVEDAATLALLREFGVDMVQGYHLDKPQADHPALG